MAAAAPPVLEVYYSPTCAPCRLELPVLAEFVDRDGTQVRIVILDQEIRARNDIRAVSVKLERAAVSPPRASPRAVLATAGDTDRILPFARTLTAAGRICATWRGRLTAETGRSLLKACLISPNRHRS
ncbi:MAG TPA: thioredoxin family protein [Rhizomicrobium sp.]|nr:thioredoxin family protein [Rhizomicrobium sp.]